MILFEKARSSAAARNHAGGDFRFNLGPHAFYARRRGGAVLRELGVPFTAARPSPSRRIRGRGGVNTRLPGGFVSAAHHRAAAAAGKLETARLLGSLRRIDRRRCAHLPVGEWLDAEHPPPRGARARRRAGSRRTYSQRLRNA